MGKPLSAAKLPKNPQLNRNYKIPIKDGKRNVTMKANKVKKGDPFFGRMKWKWKIISNKRAKKSS